MSTGNGPQRQEGITAQVPGKTGLSLNDFILLNEEIAGMARAGLPLDQGLAALAREMGGGKLQHVTARIADDLKAGHTLPEALERQGRQVPPFYAGLLAAGVRTGRVSDVLSTLTVYARTMADLRSTVLSALIYPCVILVLGITLLIFTLVFLVPRFVMIFNDFRMKLPWVTEMTIYLSRHFLELIILPVVIIVGGFFLVRFLLNMTEQGRRTWARFLYGLPIAGPLIRAARLAAFTDLLGIMVDLGMPLPEAFRLAGEASSDPLMAAGARQVHLGLSQGQALGEVLRQETLVPEVVAWMVSLGERRGTLATTLHQVAEMYRRQVEMRAATLRSVLPPFLIVLIAVITVGFLALTMLLPLISLLEGLGGGKFL